MSVSVVNNYGDTVSDTRTHLFANIFAKKKICVKPFWPVYKVRLDFDFVEILI